MPHFGRKSNDILYTVCDELVTIFREVVKEVDCSAISGFRDKEEQDEYFEKGTSKVQFPNSKHNQFPSKAIDIVPYPELYDDHDKFYFFAGYIWKTARLLGIPTRWGLEWQFRP